MLGTLFAHAELKQCSIMVGKTALPTLHFECRSCTIYGDDK